MRAAAERAGRKSVHTDPKRESRTQALERMARDFSRIKNASWRPYQGCRCGR